MATVAELYTDHSHPKVDKVSSALNPNHDNNSWNREHVWLKSHGFPSEQQLAHTDIHHLRTADVTCNSDRGNLDFDESELAHPECASRRDADSFEPRDAVKGATSHGCCSTWTSAMPAMTACRTSP
jgi:endonuclease I